MDFIEFDIVKNIERSVENNDFEYVREILNESELKTFDTIWLKMEGADYSNSIKDLTKFLFSKKNIW